MQVELSKDEIKQIRDAAMRSVYSMSDLLDQQIERGFHPSNYQSPINRSQEFVAIFDKMTDLLGIKRRSLAVLHRIQLLDKIGQMDQKRIAATDAFYQNDSAL